MKNLLLFAVALTLFSNTLVAQVVKETRSTEKRTTTDENTGQTQKITSVVEAKIEDITPHPNHAIVLAPFLFIGVANAMYFQALNDSWALGGGFQLPINWNGEQNEGGFGLKGEARFSPVKHVLKGFYIAPNTSISYVTRTNPRSSYPYTTTSEDKSGLVFTVGAMAGWQWAAWTDLMIDIGVGFDFYTSSLGSQSGEYYSSWATPTVTTSYTNHPSGTVGAIRLNIGYAW